MSFWKANLAASGFSKFLSGCSSLCNSLKTFFLTSKGSFRAWSILFCMSAISGSDAFSGSWLTLLAAFACCFGLSCFCCFGFSCFGFPSLAPPRSESDLLFREKNENFPDRLFGDDCGGEEKVGPGPKPPWGGAVALGCSGGGWFRGGGGAEFERGGGLCSSGFLPRSASSFCRFLSSFMRRFSSLHQRLAASASSASLRLRAAS
mmetsp:Transcript_18571/g.46480  ORF Transcript_18571/g.46480 Transcript_18571/m.46480 type:complete len:205 (-) Transcript_18571:2679-3293(-)